MTDEIRIPLTRICIGRFLLLLIAMLLMIVLRPMLESYAGIKLLLDLFFTLILFTGIYAIRQNKRALWIALALAGPAFFINWSGHVVALPVSTVLLGKLLGILFIVLLITVILQYLFAEAVITQDMLVGSICAYMLIGFVWASIYMIIESVHPGSFSMPGSYADQNSDFFYYSYVTLTTTGYGDIAPVTSTARAFAILEALIGQLYMAVLVARFVGVYTSQPRNG
jgi:hypothetical protein